MRLAVVADEIGTSIGEQIDSLKKANISNIELRKIDDKYLWEFSKEELINFKKILDRENIKVITLDSPVGKKPIPYERKMELFDIYLDICDIFESEYIRIFSNLGRNIDENEIKENLNRLCEKAKKRNIKLLMENERKTYAESPVDCFNLMQEEKNINIIFDLSNAFLEGYNVFEEYEKSKNRITYIHLRDFDNKTNKYAHLGQGDIGIEKFMEIIKRDNFDGVISIETHLPMNESGETKQELFLKSINLFYSILEKLKIKFNNMRRYKMERVYYDIADNFVKDLEKKLNKSIEINEKENKIKIENEIIKYEEKDIGVRSFSVPYFVENQTIINYDGNDKELTNKIEDICTAYTDIEIEAIEETMPILKKYSEERKKNLEGVAIIWRDHFLEENVGLLTSMVRMGVKPEDVLAIDKGDSTKHRQEITATFKKLGYQVDVLDNTAVANDILIEDGKRLIREFIDKRKDKKIVILDDGAIVSRILTLHNYENVEAFVELTVTGLKRIGELKENELPYPVLNVAKSKLKRFITYKEIANTIFTRSIELLAGEKLVGRTVIQLGYGDLGEVLADRYSQYGARVIVIEPDVMKCIEAAEKGFTTFRTLEEAVKYDKPFLIVGASGYNSISKEVIEQLEDGTFITSGATADLNIFKEYEKEGYKYKAIPKYGTQYEINGKKITVLGNGRSVNLFDSEAIPNRSNDIFKASQLVVTDKIINGKDDLRNQVELDIVDKWIDESNILEEYYNLYFKRK